MMYIYTNYSLYPLDVSNYDYIIETYEKKNENIGAYIDLENYTLKIKTEELSEDIDISNIIEALKNSYT